MGRAEAEAERKPLGIWAEDRAEAEEALPLDDPHFVRGCERGRRLAFDEALDEASAAVD